jgi:hypothetical protein
VYEALSSILQLEQELAAYLAKHSNTRTKEMTRIAFDIVDQLREQVLKLLVYEALSYWCMRP